MTPTQTQRGSWVEVYDATFMVYGIIIILHDYSWRIHLWGYIIDPKHMQTV